ncbi:hypothetical protein BCU89_05760 [Vibrio splendidus]|nr:hypothetical protein BCU89_05760 [Vibrio splendidus]
MVTNSTNQQLRTNDLTSLIKATGKTDSERQKPTRWRMNLTNEGCGGLEIEGRKREEKLKASHHYGAMPFI